jgi:hypothetical protein
MYFKKLDECCGSEENSDDDDYYSDDDVLHKDKVVRHKVTIGGRTNLQIQEMINVLAEGTHKISPTYQIGGPNWRTLWSAALNVMGSSRYRHESLPSISKSHNNEEEELFEDGNSLPSIDSKHKRKQVDHKLPKRSSEDSISTTVSQMTREKQKYLLDVLCKIETNLERNDVGVNPIGLVKPVMKNKPSENIKYAFENKIKYGHVAAVIGEVSNTLRKIGIALEAPVLKHKYLDFIGVR